MLIFSNGGDPILKSTFVPFFWQNETSQSLQ